MNLLYETIKNYNVKVVNIINDETSLINNKVKKIFVINLAEDTYKRNYIVMIMKKYGINFSLVIVERITKNIYDNLDKKISISISELGCCLSHLWCLYQIIINNYENAIIFEDDIILHKNFTQRFLDIHDKNKDLDFLLLGAHDFNFINYGCKNVKNNLYRPDSKNTKIYGAHANYYSLKGAKRMFHIRTSQISYFDKEYLLMFNYYTNSSFICYPNLVVSNITESTLDHEREILSNLEYEYYKKCFVKFNFKQYNFIYINLLNSNIPIDQKDNYKTYIEKCLYHYFYNFDKINAVINRLSFDFFTIDDIRTIMTV